MWNIDNIKRKTQNVKQNLKNKKIKPRQTNTTNETSEQKKRHYKIKNIDKKNVTQTSIIRFKTLQKKKT